MSSKTENLELFKYDPVADKDQTFNIELALNQNWDKVDKEIAQREGLLRSSAVKEGVSDTDAIAIVDDADSSKTKRVLWSTIKSALSKIYVPLTRKINRKSLSSDVTLTGADIQVSGTDNTKIDAALSNKANVYLNLAAIGLSGQVTISQVCAAMQDGRFFAAWNDTSFENCISDAPDTYTLITIYRAAAPYVICRAVRISDGKEHVGTWNPDREPNWTGWVPQTTDTPPQEYDLPLTEGITALQPCSYYKNQFSEVTIGGCTSGPVSDGATIATLPVGFRPCHTVERPATFQADDGSRFAGTVFISDSGGISIHTPSPAKFSIFSASFTSN